MVSHSLPVKSSIVIFLNFFFFSGSVLTIETLDWKHQETWHDNCMDPDATLTVSQNKSWKLYVTFLRVFFELGPPSGQKIG